jgi:hypothetical protein
MALLGSALTLSDRAVVPHLWVKLHTSVELKSIRIAMPTVLGKLWCGHITSVFSPEWLNSCGLFGKCPAVVPCATADGESGSSLKLGSCVDQHHEFLDTRKLVLKMFLNESLHTTGFSANEP